MKGMLKMIRGGLHLIFGCLFLLCCVGQAVANTFPTVSSDTVRVEQNGRVNISVLANDTDADGDSLQIRGLLVDANHSRLLVVNTDGTIHYRPQLEFVGQDSFVYLVDDGHEGLAGATVYITVVPFYRAIDDTVYVKVGQSKSFSVLGNDHYDRERDSIYVTSLTPGQHTDRVVVNTDQTIFYAPKGEYLGVDTIGYATQTTSGRQFEGRMFVHNVRPSFAVNDSHVIRQGGRLNLWPLDNDWVVPGDTLKLVSFEKGAHAERLLQNSDGTLHYRPRIDFLGTDQFSYTVSDQQGNVSDGTVFIDVLPLNRVQNDTVVINAGGRVNIDVLANDQFFGSTEPRILAFGEGSISERVVLNFDGTLHYRPLVGVSGQDHFTYEIESGQDGGRVTGIVVIVIRSLEDILVLRPDSVRVFANQSLVIDVLGNDWHVDGQVLRVVDVSVQGDAVIMQNNTVFFRPTFPARQVDLTYTVEDEKGVRATQKVFISQPIDRAVGFAADDFAVVIEGGVADIDVMANDRGGLHLVGADVAAHGQLSVADGRVLYVPEDGYVGEDVFIYIAADDTDYRVAARVFVRVEEDSTTNNPPVPSGETGDFDGDGQVGFADFLMFVGQFGLGVSDSNYDARMDFDGDGVVGFADFVKFTGLFG